jgi:hypothetical protein
VHRAELPDLSVATLSERRIQLATFSSMIFVLSLARGAGAEEFTIA